jgi:hypothetical protein
VRVRRIVLAAIGCALAGAIVVLPFWLWMRGGIPDAFIPHNSRSNFLIDVNAQALFLWGVYGLIPALAVYGLWRRPNRRTAAVTALAGLLGVLGLGGTTPLPSLLFGRQWEWLTYDRFALWGAVALLPLAGIAISHLLSLRVAAGRVLAIVAMMGIALFAGSDAVSSVLGPALPYQRDLRPIAQFMNDGRTAWRRIERILDPLGVRPRSALRPIPESRGLPPTGTTAWWHRGLGECGRAAAFCRGSALRHPRHPGDPLGHAPASLFRPCAAPGRGAIADRSPRAEP